MMSTKTIAVMKILQSRREIAQGKTMEVDDAYFDKLRARILTQQK